MGLPSGFPDGDAKAAWEWDPTSAPPLTTAVRVPSLEEQEEEELASLASSMRSVQECIEAQKGLEEEVASWRKAVTRIRQARRKRRRHQVEADDPGEDGSSKRVKRRQED